MISSLSVKVMAKTFGEIKVGDTILHVRFDSQFKYHTRVILVKSIKEYRNGRYFIGVADSEHDGGVVDAYTRWFVASTHLSRSIANSLALGRNFFCTDESLISKIRNKIMSKLISVHNQILCRGVVRNLTKKGNGRY